MRVHIDESGCWLWMGAKTGVGYGDLKWGGDHYSAHRFSYEFFVGPIPSGLTVDHLCMVRHCINPQHFELVTGGENTRRAWANRTTCRRGHPYGDGADTRRTPDGYRKCSTCASNRNRTKRLNRLEAKRSSDAA